MVFTRGDVTSTDQISRQFNNLSQKFPSDKQIGNRQGIIIENIQDLGIGETGRFNLMTKYLQSKGYESRLPSKGLEDKKINDQIPSEEMENAYQYFLKTIEEPSDVVVAFDPKKPCVL